MPTKPNKTPAPTRRSEATEELTNLKVVVVTLVKENKELNLKVTESLKFHDFLNEKFEEHRKVNDEVLAKLKEFTKQNMLLMEKNKALEEEIKKEREERSSLEERFYQVLNPIEIEKREKNLELHGELETENENCQEKVTQILAKITPKPVKVIRCYRTGYKYDKNGEAKTRPIFIQFETKYQRDLAFASRVNLKKIDDRKLYLNEDLPPNLKMLRGKANAFKKENDFRFLWMKNGNLFLRKTEDSKIFNIKKASDLEKIN